MDRLFKNNAYMILEVFIDNPNEDFHIRKIARMLRLTHPTVSKHVNDLLKSGFIRKRTDSIYPLFYADVESSIYRFYKKNHIVEKIRRSGLVEQIQKEALPSSIILFGSCARGVYTNESDIDIFVESQERKIELKKFEKSLKRPINILFEKRITDLSHELGNNILNGVVLYGFINIWRER